MAKIALLIPSHLYMTPRAQKAARSLSAHGYEVEVFGFNRTKEMAVWDQKIAEHYQINFTNLYEHKKTLSLIRIAEKISKKIFKTRSIPVSDVMLAIKMFHRTNPDLVIGFGELGLYAAVQWGRKGFLSMVDFEDFYSKDLLPTNRKQLPKLLTEYEEEAVHKIPVCFTASNAMAEGLNEEYKTDKTLTIYNSFPDDDESEQDFSKILHQDDRLRLYWFSQTIGPGRGLENFVSRLNQSLQNDEGNISLYVQGNLPTRYQKWFRQITSDNKNLNIIHVEAMLPWDAAAFMKNMHIGLALEESAIPCRDMTVTNKVFQYMQAGLGIFATSTKGQREVLDSCSSTKFVDQLSDDEFRSFISKLLNESELNSFKHGSTEYFDKHFRWELQENVLIERIKKALG